MALLRGVNVSGKRRVPMADLRRSLEDLGLRRVRTHLQSGNVVFEAPEDFAADPDERMAASGRAAIAAAIRARIARDFGHDVEVLVAPSRGLRQIAAANPFAGDVVYLLLPHGYGPHEAQQTPTSRRPLGPRRRPGTGGRFWPCSERDRASSRRLRRFDDKHRGQEVTNG